MITLHELTERLLKDDPPVSVRFQFKHSVSWYDLDEDDEVTKLALGKEVIAWGIEETEASGGYAKKYNVSKRLYIDVLLVPRYKQMEDEEREQGKLYEI